MTEVASRFATQATLPIMLDSTEPPVIERGLQHIAGKPILNSVNLEDGDAAGTRLDAFLSLAREYGAAVVCTCIDTEGQARTAEWKAAGRRRHLRPRRRPLRPGARGPLLRPPGAAREHRHGRKPPGRHRDDRGHTADQGRAPRGADRCSGSPMFRSASARPPARPSTRCSSTSASRPASMPPSSTPAASCRSTGSPPKRSRSASTSSTTAVTPPATMTRWPSCCAFSKGPSRRGWSEEDRSDWPVERRLEQRVVDG